MEAVFLGKVRENIMRKSSLTFISTHEVGAYLQSPPCFYSRPDWTNQILAPEVRIRESKAWRMSNLMHPPTQWVSLLVPPIQYCIFLTNTQPYTGTLMMKGVDLSGKPLWLKHVELVLSPTTVDKTSLLPKIATYLFMWLNKGSTSGGKREDGVEAAQVETCHIINSWDWFGSHTPCPCCLYPSVCTSIVFACI